MHSFTARLFSFVVLIGILGLVQGQAKSNFSGTWKLDTSKSDFGPLPSPDSMTETIVHKDPSLKVSLTQTGGLGDITMDLSYTTDGAECVNHVRQNEIRSIFKWDGDDLVVDIKGKYGETDYKSKDRWTLSSDGKTLTITRHVSSPMGEADVKELFVKQ
jgi:hypothetical protein